MTLLDWLDKVRVGLWLSQIILTGNPANIAPKFAITNRISTKDRMVLVYPMSDTRRGLSPYGIETLTFHHHPSVFGLRVNNLIIINASADHLFGASCGFHAPTKLTHHLDGKKAGLLEGSGFTMTRKPSYPLMPSVFPKPSIRVFQTIFQRGLDGRLPLVIEQNESYHLKHIADRSTGKFVPFVESSKKVTPIFDPSCTIKFEAIEREESSTAGLILAAMYEYQADVYQALDFRADAADHNERARALQAELVAQSRLFAAHYRSRT
ncbi:MAG: hypothetical protein GC187_11945 [Alphaproteobacteria bacterium]|nr:hypothetical protein [Alphaproteobacteria bacterium]